MSANLLKNFCPASVFITGCSRGIGLEFVKQFCQLPTPPKHLFATCRHPDSAKELKAVAEKHSNVHVLKFDVTDYASLPGIVDSVRGVTGSDGLNLLMNNAGALTRAGLDDVTPEMMRDNYETNCIAPLMIAKAFLPLLRDASAKNPDRPMGGNRATIINVSTKVASIADNGFGGLFPYRCSKIALNMVNKNISIDLLKDKIAVYLVHPGWVQTELGGKGALTSTEESVKGLMDVLAGLGEKENGLFFDFRGNPIPW